MEYRLAALLLFGNPLSLGAAELQEAPVAHATIALTPLLQRLCRGHWEPSAVHLIVKIATASLNNPIPSWAVHHGGLVMLARGTC